MRNLENAIAKVKKHKGPLSKGIVCYTAKQTINQYNRGWVKPKDLETAIAINNLGICEFLEKPLKGRKLDKDLTEKGIQWLRKFLFTSKGLPRNTKEVIGVSHKVFEIVKNFSHFTFERFDDGGYGDYVPVWRVHAKNGESFKYTYTGGGFSRGGGGFEYWF